MAESNTLCRLAAELLPAQPMARSLVKFFLLPVLTFACSQTSQAQVYSYPGSSSLKGVAVDNAGNVIMAGLGPLTKFRADGTTVFALPVYFLVTNAFAMSEAIGVDRAGNILVVASGLGGPVTADAPQPTYGAFYLARLDPNGNLISATYFGGLGASNVLRAFFDPNGDVYVLGSSNGSLGNTDPYFQEDFSAAAASPFSPVAESVDRSQAVGVEVTSRCRGWKGQLYSFATQYGRGGR